MRSLSGRDLAYRLGQYSVFSNCSATVTVSPSGPRKLFKGVTTAMSGVLARFPLLLPVRNPVAGYGASVVTRTPDRGHVAEVKNQFHRGGGVSIRVSSGTEYPVLSCSLCPQHNFLYQVVTRGYSVVSIPELLKGHAQCGAEERRRPAGEQRTYAAAATRAVRHGT